MSGFENSASAISAALRIEAATAAPLPEADSGRISATFTCPAPTWVGCADGGGGCELKPK